MFSKGTSVVIWACCRQDINLFIFNVRLQGETRIVMIIQFLFTLYTHKSIYSFKWCQAGELEGNYIFLKCHHLQIILLRSWQSFVTWPVSLLLEFRTEYPFLVWLSSHTEYYRPWLSGVTEPNHRLKHPRWQNVCFQKGVLYSKGTTLLQIFIWINIPTASKTAMNTIM